MRNKIIAGNWKMNMDLTGSIELIEELSIELKYVQKCDVVFCPPFPLLLPVKEAMKNTRFELGAQNMFWEDKGAYTGEVSANMLLSVGCNYVILGHSERRKYFNETNETVNKRVQKALLAGLKPIVCIGETLEERESEQTRSVIENQLKYDLQGFCRDDVVNLILAYEPIWAIGTGKTATPDQAVEVHQFIRDLLSKLYDEELAQIVRIQYGGSVNNANARDLLGRSDIDGALVGGASLKAQQFAKIVEAGELNS